MTPNACILLVLLLIANVRCGSGANTDMSSGGGSAASGGSASGGDGGGTGGTQDSGGSSLTGGDNTGSGGAGNGTGGGVVDGGVGRPSYPSRLLSQYKTGCVVRADNKLSCWDPTGFVFLDDITANPAHYFVDFGDLDEVFSDSSYAGFSDLYCVHSEVAGYRCAGMDNASPDLSLVQIAGYGYLSNSPDTIRCGLLGSGKVICWDRDAQVVEQMTPSGEFIQLDVVQQERETQNPDGGLPDPSQQSNYIGPLICGLRSDGTVTCWGRSFCAAPITDTTGHVYAGYCEGSDSAEFAFPADTRFVQIATRAFLRCGITVDSDIVCWAESRLLPLQVPVPSGKAKLVSVGGHRACAIMEDDSVQCFGELDPSSYSMPDPSVRMKTLSVGLDNDCGIDVDDQVWCWGGLRKAEVRITPEGAPLIARHQD